MALVETAKYPAAIATEADMQNWKNVVSGNSIPFLQSSLTSGATTATLAAGTGVRLPSDNFTVTIDSEIIFVASRSTDTLNGLVRGYEGTTAAAHSAGVNVVQNITAKSHNQVVSEIVAIQTALGANLNKLVNMATPSFSATPSFDGSVNTAFKITLTGNVTSSTFTGGRTGFIYVFEIIQDSTGGRSFTWPSNVKGGMTIDSSTAANSVSTQLFFYDGINLYALGPGIEN